MVTRRAAGTYTCQVGQDVTCPLESLERFCFQVGPVNATATVHVVDKRGEHRLFMVNTGGGVEEVLPVMLLCLYSLVMIQEEI